jgi:hypothetical protein
MVMAEDYGERENHCDDRGAHFLIQTGSVRILMALKPLQSQLLQVEIVRKASTFQRTNQPSESISCYQQPWQPLFLSLLW